MKNNEKNMKKNKKSGKGMGLLLKLSGISTFFILLAIVVFSVISVNSVRTSSMETAVIMGKEKLLGDMMYFEVSVYDEYGQLSLKNGELVSEHGVSLENRYKLVDDLNAQTGVVATVFVRDGMDFRRISTSLVNDSGERAVGTFLGSNSAAYPSVMSGADYSGKAVILGNDYLTLYRPVFAADKKEVIGILFIGIEISKIHDLISQNLIKQVILIIIIAVAILLALLVVNTLSLSFLLVKPIKAVTSIIRKLSSGHINLQIDAHHSRDELGQMTDELGILVNNLKNTAGFAHNIGEGHLDAHYDMLSDDDILGRSLLEMRQSLQKAAVEQATHANEEKRRNWGTAGLAKFAEILRQDNDNMEALAHNVISSLVKYLDANQGGIFILNDAEDENDKVLELKACYAFNRKKYAERQILPGEGLVGTCYREREIIYLTEIPRDYISITSGLGDASPGAILISPLKLNDTVYGVVEIASFTGFEPYRIEFVEKVSESIAATISSVNVAIRTNKLLEQTRSQT